MPPQTEEISSDYITIDEFATRTGVSTRTIRYYQSRGLLQHPTRRGRVAFYGPPHADRIALIEELQSRGLTLRAIKDLVRGQGSDNQPLEAWLGLDRLREGWTGEPPKLMSRSELEDLVGEGGAASIKRLLDADVIQLDEQDGSRRYRSDPALVGCALALESGGVSLEVSKGIHSIIDRQFVAAAREAIDFLYRRRGSGFGDSDLPEDVSRAIEAIFPAGGSPFVQLIFARAVDKALGEWLESDGPRQLGRESRKRKDSDAKSRKKRSKEERHERKQRRKRD